MEKSENGLTDGMWQAIREFLPGKAGDPGVTAADNRLFVEAILWRARTGVSWRDLPERFGKWNSVFKRYRRWALKGVIDRIFKVLSEDFDLEYVCVDDTVTRTGPAGAGRRR